MYERFIDSPGLFGLGIGSSTQGELHCDVCGAVYNKGADRGEDVVYNNVHETTFAGLTVAECCFGRIEAAVLRCMPEILTWYGDILKARKEKLDADEALFDSVTSNSSIETSVDEARPSAVSGFPVDDAEYEVVIEAAIDDYIEGVELVGMNAHKVCGWVDSVIMRGSERIFHIQCDDGYRGHRGSTIYGRYGIRKRRKAKVRPKIDL